MDQDEQFLADLESAKALSLQTLEEDRIRREEKYGIKFKGPPPLPSRPPAVGTPALPPPPRTTSRSLSKDGDQRKKSETVDLIDLSLPPTAAPTTTNSFFLPQQVHPVSPQPGLPLAQFSSWSATNSSQLSQTFNQLALAPAPPSTIRSSTNLTQQPNHLSNPQQPPFLRPPSTNSTSTRLAVDPSNNLSHQPNPLNTQSHFLRPNPTTSTNKQLSIVQSTHHHHSSMSHLPQLSSSPTSSSSFAAPARPSNYAQVKLEGTGSLTHSSSSPSFLIEPQAVRAPTQMMPPPTQSQKPSIHYAQFQNVFTPNPVFDQPVDWSSSSLLPLRGSAVCSSAHKALTQGTEVLQVCSKKPNENLIDLGEKIPSLEPLAVEGSAEFMESCRSILKFFDPLSAEPSSTTATEEEEEEMPAPEKDDINEYTSPSNPFEYLTPRKRKPVEDIPPTEPKKPPVEPMPPKVTKHRRNASLHGTLNIYFTEHMSQDREVEEFCEVVSTLRGRFRAGDVASNPGLIISPRICDARLQSEQLRVIVHCGWLESPVLLSCECHQPIKDLVSQVLEKPRPDGTNGVHIPQDFVLKVAGVLEYMTPNSRLSDYAYVHRCLKFEREVVLSLVPIQSVEKFFARTEEDDAHGSELFPPDVVSIRYGEGISHHDLKILLDNYQSARESLLESTTSSESSSKYFKQLVQSVKAIVALVGGVETLGITHALEVLGSTCNARFTPGSPSRSSGAVVMEDQGDYCIVQLNRSRSVSSTPASAVRQVTDQIRSLLEMYARSHRVDFTIEGAEQEDNILKDLADMTDALLVSVCSIHSLVPTWKYARYFVTCEIWNGTIPISSSVRTLPRSPKKSFRLRVPVDEWVMFPSLPVCALPRDARLVLTLSGVPQTEVMADSSMASDISQVVPPPPVELGWTALQLFNVDGQMTDGSYVLHLWPLESDKRLGPAPSLFSRPIWPDVTGGMVPKIVVLLPDLGGRIFFPEISPSEIPEPRQEDFEELDVGTQQKLLDVVDSDIFSPITPELQDVVWDKRRYLYKIPNALPRVLLAAHAWDFASLAEMDALMKSWAEMDPMEALQLLLPCFPQQVIRSRAVHWLRRLSSDDLLDILPQLVQAAKHESHLSNPLILFLFERALRSPLVAHRLYWLLMHSHPNPNEDPVDARYSVFLRIQATAFYSICGTSLQKILTSQDVLIQQLDSAAATLKTTSDSMRLSALTREMEEIHEILKHQPTALPLSLSHLVSGVDVKRCSYFNSKTLPLKIKFLSAHHSQKGSNLNRLSIQTIYKVGDDLRKDSLTLQMIGIMNTLWLKAGLDLKMVLFSCVPTGDRRGFVEMVTEAETLRKIQAEHGVTGAFRERAISDWLRKHNVSQGEYGRAIDNFTASTAGYCVATYVLGVCDRHNDNIMVKPSGHLFHIDFGKFLGDAEMFAGFSRDRSPFVLTKDMVCVINEGDKSRFQTFVDHCVNAFNILRYHASLFLNLFALMASSGIPGVSLSAVHTVRKALMPELTDDEAASEFTRLIERSVNCFFTQVNFFVHALAQMRFTEDNGAFASKLTFVPVTFTQEQDGRILHLKVWRYQKHYEVEKQYFFIVQVERKGLSTPQFVFRSYLEFLEFQRKLSHFYPLADIPLLPERVAGRRGTVTTKEAAEKAIREIGKFLNALTNTADEIAHCDLVYTFFHPLKRDEQQADVYSTKLRKAVDDRSHKNFPVPGRIQGHVRFGFVYSRGSFRVTIHHAKNLRTSQDAEPNAYAKVYLLSDPRKATKRKTRIVKKNSHPTFMEPIEYRLPLSYVQSKTLFISLYHYDPLSENEFLGAVRLNLRDLDLTKEFVDWYPLTN
ncbi:unnamed protein product [Cyprideis torosa]|uniref:Uncharacterized protein n=1 Tax=Cyprideis torosa TaxID=163714 RepID=A0A7R8WH08_9CRUS|nr:unnamed protein product [Cyprideis torosa]CAG0893611.1 unnamed protein product [Cyprideis torosa]